MSTVWRVTGVLAAVFAIASAVWLTRADTETSPSPGDTAVATPWVTDDRGLLSAPERASIGRYHRHLLKEQDIDLRVLIADTRGRIDAFAAEAFRRMRVGSRSRAGHGLLLVVDPDARKVRMEVGRSLEGFFSDGFIKRIEHHQLVPFFQANRVGDGIVATTELIVERAIEGRARHALREEGEAEASTGAGARDAVRIGEGYSRPEYSGPIRPSSPDGPPKTVVQHYIDAMQRGDARPDLPLYSASTRAFLKKRLVTPAQMETLAQTYRKCGTPTERIEGDRAVVRFPPKAHRCAPFFLVREDGSWRLDLVAASRAIAFDFGNQWRFRHLPSEWRFGFSDWRFDISGKPLEISP